MEDLSWQIYTTLSANHAAGLSQNKAISVNKSSQIFNTLNIGVIVH